MRKIVVVLSSQLSRNGRGLEGARPAREMWLAQTELLEHARGIEPGKRERRERQRDERDADMKETGSWEEQTNERDREI